MPRELIEPSVVILAQNFNPSVASQLWLVRNGVVREEAFLPGCVFMDMFVQVRTPRFGLVVAPQQLVFVPTVPEPEQQDLIVDKVGQVVRALPHTPYKALGLNFNWQVTPIDVDVARLSRELFFLPNRAIYREFDTADAQFGGYLSKNILGFRLKVDAKPITVLTEQGPQARLQFLFNFHADITPNETAARMIDELLHQWRAAGNHSYRLIETIPDGGAA